jgi:heterodisulfide reductase subunit B
LLATALPAGELVKVRDDMDLEAVAVPCAACFNRFQGANHAVTDPAIAADVADVVGRPYDGGVRVLDLVDVYHDHVGLEAIRARVVKPFRGLRVACYYGCLLTRPPKVTLAEDPEYPVHMDEVVRAIGCSPVDWDAKTDCCGAGLALCERDVVDGLIGRIVTNARERGAQAIVCACPLCQINLDGRQREIRRKDPAWVEMPIVFLSQMVGRALGVSDERLGLRRAMVDATTVLAEGDGRSSARCGDAQLARGTGSRRTARRRRPTASVRPPLDRGPERGSGVVRAVRRSAYGTSGEHGIPPVRARN